MKQSHISVSVVIPAHNEAESIAAVIDAVERQVARETDEYEILIVDDGSADGTFQHVQEISLRNPHVRGLLLSRNFGKEAALLAGLRAAVGDAVITIDADLQHPPELIPEMIRAWRRGAAIVNAVKRSRGTENAFFGWRAALVNGTLSRLSGINLRNSSDFKLLDRQAVDVIVTWLPEKMRFYRGLTQWIGFKQEDLLFDVRLRESGRSSWSMRALVRLALTALVSFTSAPLRIVTVLGMVTMLIGTVIAADALWSWYRGESVSGFVTLIVTLLFLGSVIMISLGIIGEYIAKIYDEIKARPSYLVASTCGSRSLAAGREHAPPLTTTSHVNHSQELQGRSR